MEWTYQTSIDWWSGNLLDYQFYDPDDDERTGNAHLGETIQTAIHRILVYVIFISMMILGDSFTYPGNIGRN